MEWRGWEGTKQEGRGVLWSPKKSLKYTLRVGAQPTTTTTTVNTEKCSRSVIGAAAARGFNCSRKCRRDAALETMASACSVCPLHNNFRSLDTTDTKQLQRLQSIDIRATQCDVRRRWVFCNRVNRLASLYPTPTSTAPRIQR